MAAFASPPVICKVAASSEAAEICKVSVLATTLPVPFGAIVMSPLEFVDENVLASNLRLSTFRIVNVPRLVTLPVLQYLMYLQMLLM